jgi:hypothetical protein
MALTEAICYSIQIERCREYLRKEGLDVNNKTIRLILAAPDQYWTHWGSDKHMDFSGMVNRMTNIVESVAEILSPSFKLKLELFSLRYEKDGILVNPVCLE